ncbi:MAG: hypothetical protein AVDCRST_MAG18-1360, partial [uncultured Thermomicrobiales bacterium]
YRPRQHRVAGQLPRRTRHDLRRAGRAPARHPAGRDRQRADDRGCPLAAIQGRQWDDRLGPGAGCDRRAV